MDTISVIGLGYIGLPTASVIASNGVKTYGVDIDTKTVDSINSGKSGIVEPGLDKLLKKVVNNGSLTAITKPKKSDVFIIAVPTPFKKSLEGNAKFEPDVSYVESAIHSIAPLLEKGNLIIIESTCPTGTTEMMCNLISKERPDLKLPNEESKDSDIYLAYCPERVLPGKILDEIVNNDRVIGGISQKCSMMAVRLYEIFIKGGTSVTNSRTAEMAKLTENAFRDVNIAFANELSMICDGLDINVWDLINISNKHPRVNILKPGPGVGGHCIAVDPWFIVHRSPDKARLIQTARTINDYKPKFIIQKVLNLTSKFNSPVIACLGVAFKADIDDLRESPSLNIIKELSRNESIQKLLIVEPNITKLPESLRNEKSILVDEDEAIKKADIILLLVDHKEFYLIDANTIKNKVIIDTRGIL